MGIPSLRLRGDYLAIVTLGFAEIIRIIILNIDRVGGATGFRGAVPPWEGRPIIPLYANFIWIGGFAVITIVVVYNIVHSDIGRALISIREDELAAEAMGINTTRYKVLAFVISSAFAGHCRRAVRTLPPVSAHERFPVHPLDRDHHHDRARRNGIDHRRGARRDCDHDSARVAAPAARRSHHYRLVIYSALLVVIMLTRPQGVMGAREFGIPWLKRAQQRRPEGDKPAGEKGVPIAQQTSSPAMDRATRSENTGKRTWRKRSTKTNGEHPLRTSKCTIRFGGLVAVNELDMNVREGEIYGLIGPNGAGKTTIFNLLTGVYEPTPASFTSRARRIDGLKPYEISRRGVSRTFQNIRLFPSMSVLENVMTACHRHAKQNLLDAVLRLPRFERDEREHREFAMELLEIFDLARFKDEGGTSLPYGSQRRLEIVRALATRPKLLLLDEPAAGMNPSEQEDLMKLIKQIRDRFGLTILLVEHNMKVVMGVCERIQVVDYGKSIASAFPRRSRTIRK